MFVVGFVLFIGGVVRIDQSTGHFGRITVPGESYGLPDVGTYVITDGNYAAGMHQNPVFTVTGPGGEDVPVELVPSHRYGHEDNALAIFHVTTRGRHRLEVTIPEGADQDMPTTVTVDRSMDGTGDPLTSAYIAVGAGFLLVAASFLVGVVATVKVVRLSTP